MKPNFSFMSLPYHIIEDIINLVDSPRKSLRLINRTFNDSLTQHICSSAQLRLSGTSSDFINFLSQFTTGLTTSHKYTKNLTIRDLYPPDRAKRFQFIPGSLIGYENEEDWEVVKELFPAAVAGFENVTSVKWYIRDFDTDGWIPHMVMKGLRQLSKLETLEIYMSGSTKWKTVDFSSIPRLRNLSLCVWNAYRVPGNKLFRGVSDLLANSADTLEELTIQNLDDVLGPRDVSTLDIFSVTPTLKIQELSLAGYVIKDNTDFVSHLRHLKSLSITNPPYSNTDFYERVDPPTYQDTIWSVLSSESIWLEHISVQNLTTNLVQYVKSYTGLKSFSIMSENQYSSPLSRDMSVELQAHASTLESLQIQS